MYKARLSPRFLWIGLIVVSLIVLAQYFSTEYMSDLSQKVAQAIAETETSGGSVDATEGNEEK